MPSCYPCSCASVAPPSPLNPRPFCAQHQDWPYERHSVPSLAAAITYLDPTDHEAGATEALRGSHLCGEWATCVGHTIPDEAIARSGLEPVVLAAEPGDVAIMHVLTVHRAGHNYTERGRHAIINGALHSC